LVPPGGNVEVPDLVRDVLAGDGEAADRLYESVRPGLLRMALALGVGPESAADLVQDTLWAAHRRLERYDPERASFEGWLAVILVRRTRNFWRGRRRMHRVLGLLRAVRTTGEERDREVLEARLTVDRLLAGLTPRQREVVALYEISGLGADRVAEILGISPAGVRSLARDARRKLTEAVRSDRPAEEDRR
jgi:RNA polymerase sigma-70 factor (ECF subfamily)